MRSRKPIQWRSFTTFLIVMAFFIIATTGIVLYITPPGRIANWTGWRLMGLTKSQWQSIHTIFAFLFVFAAAVHLYFNWKVLLGYLRARIEQRSKYLRELVASMSIVIVIFVLTLNHVTPFGTIMDVGEDLKNSWSAPEKDPPIPHAELLTLNNLSGTLNIPVETLRHRIESAGLTAESNSTTLGQIAERHGLTPREVYDKVTAAGPGAGRSLIGEGGGYGRKTIAQICQQLHIQVEEGLRRLELRSIKARPEQTAREVALEHGMTPADLARVLSGELN